MSVKKSMVKGHGGIEVPLFLHGNRCSVHKMSILVENNGLKLFVMIREEAQEKQRFATIFMYFICSSAIEPHHGSKALEQVKCK